MQIVPLSDHPGDLLKASRQRGTKAQQSQAARYDSAVARHQAGVKRLEAARDEARASRRWLAWLRAVLAVRRERRQAPARPRPVRAPSEEEAKLEAGIKGEQLVADELGRALGDDWVLLRGYHNRRGEIDHLLLGPRGLVAIEVKNQNGTVHCDGDSWWIDKYDRYGNQVEPRTEMTDQGKRHRSPSVQLNEPADLLEEFLRSRGEDVDLLRVVLLAHRRARIGNCRGATVSIFTDTSEIIALMRKVPQPLDGPRRQRLRELVVQDHRYHAAHRPPR